MSALLMAFMQSLLGNTISASETSALSLPALANHDCMRFNKGRMMANYQALTALKNNGHTNMNNGGNSVWMSLWES